MRAIAFGEGGHVAGDGVGVLARALGELEQVAQLAHGHDLFTSMWPSMRVIQAATA